MITPILDKINDIKDLRTLDKSHLALLANELRYKTMEIVSKTGGHLGASLGVVELTIALHYVFNTPEDLLIWDVGHQSCPHKILTDRKNVLNSFRQPDGISGFTKKSESIFDPFGAGHSSTSISAALGMAIARDLNNDKHKEVIAVIGDGAISAGMAYEAMNNAGATNTRMIVVLNDNDMSISPPVGAMNTYLSKLISSKSYLGLRNTTKKFVSVMPNFFSKFINKIARNTKDVFNDGNFFEEMGFYYIGPIDGHNVDDMVSVLDNIKNSNSINRPVLLHVVTEKGKGFKSSENNLEKFHSVKKFDLTTGVQEQSNKKSLTYTKVFADELVNIAKNDQKVVAITAAMSSGTGLDLFAKHFPNRMFDVGIAEQHAVTYAAGLSCEGYKPFVAIYSTFLQRAYDQIIHDVAIQELPVRFIIDRAGFVGADGPTHAGSFDIAYLSIIPNFIIMVPSNECELIRMINTAYNINDAPSAIRYPRGNVSGIKFNYSNEPLAIGKGKIIQSGSRVAVLNLGTRIEEVQKASDYLKKTNNIKITIADARFAKPIDYNLVKDLAINHDLLIIIEEGSIGGFSSMVLNYLANNLLTNNLTIKTLHYPDFFMPQGNQDEMSEKAGLGYKNILEVINNYLNHNNKTKAL